MATLSLQNPLFATYVIAATLMILKVLVDCRSYDASERRLSLA
jgi:hypothetical protein